MALPTLKSRASRSKPVRSRTTLIVEQLEDRCLLAVYNPAQILHAYGFDQIAFGGIQGDGRGQTIAVVDAYHHPKVNYDFQTFNAQWGISNNDGDGNYALTVVNQTGGTNYPAYNAGWSQEIALDVEWAHAVAPGAHILLVEAASNSFANLFTAVQYASQHASVVSMSWGSTEFSSESSWDSYFTTPNVSYVASSGDTGATVSYPAVSPNVLGVGGTTLNLADSTGTYGSESAWNSSGGGISAYESKPAYQNGVVSGTKRASPDVSYNADPNTGVYVHWTSNTQTTGGWYSFGGTSAGAPQWAGLVAIANQGRAIDPDGDGPLTAPGALSGGSQLLPAIYALPASDFHDVTTGKAGRGRNTNNAGTGFDLATGRGSPIANLVVGHLVTADANGQQPPAAPAGGGSGGGAGSPSAEIQEIAANNPRAVSPLHGLDAPDLAALLANGRTITFVVAPVNLAPSQAPGAVNSTATVRINYWISTGRGDYAVPINDAEDDLTGSDMVSTRRAYFRAAPAFAERTETATSAAALSPAFYAPISLAAPSAHVPAAADSESAAETSDLNGGSLTKAVTKILGLVGAALFFTQGAFLANPQGAAKEDDRKRQPQA